MMYKYTTDTFSLSDEVRFNKWFNDNKDYDLSNSPINSIFQAEALQVDISPETYKGLTLTPGASYTIGSTPPETIILTEQDVEGYFSKYPHHQADLPDVVYQEYIKALKNGQSTLDANEKESLPEDYDNDQASATAEEYYKNQKPQTKEFQYVIDDSSSNHFHFIEIDSDGNGWTYGPMVTDQTESPNKYHHIHQIIDYKIQPEIWIGKDKTSKPITAYNVEHSHELQKLTVTVPPVNPDGSTQKPLPDAPPSFLIDITSGNYIGETLQDGDIKYTFSVTNLATNLYESIEFIPGSLTKGYDIDTDEEITNLAKAYFNDLIEKYPNYELRDKVGLFSETDGEVVVETPPPVDPQEEDEPEPAPYLELAFDDQRYSEELFIGVNNLDKINPFDIPTTMGYLLFSKKMLKDFESDEKHWIEMLTSYTVPTPVIKPSKSSKKDKSGQLSKEDFESTKGEQSLLKENLNVNNYENKLNKYNLEKLTKQFSGNTAFPDLESGLNKLRGSENVVASIYGEVLHRVNIRELLVRAMACLVAKLNPGDWVEIACKTIIKEVAREIGFNKVKKIIIEEWNKLSKSVEGSAAVEELKRVKQKLQEAEKSGALVDRKRSKNLTIIDGKDPFSEEFGQIQQRELAKEKERNISNKAKIDDFVKDIKDFIDLDALCERFGEFINDATKLLFASGGLGVIKLNFNLLFPGLPKIPTIQLPTLPTKDIMKELIEAMERAAKEMIVRAIVDLIKGIIDEALSQCEDVVTPAPIIPPEQSIGIPELVPNIPGAASPLNYDNVNQNDFDDLGIPPHMAFSVKELLDWMAQFLKPNQLCKLLSGTSSEGLLRIVLSQIEQRYEVLSLYIKTTADVRRLFVRLGEKVDQTFCTAVVSNVSAISDLCEDIIDNSIHEDALRAKGFSVDEAATIILEDRNRKMEALEKLSEYFVNPDAIQTQVPPALCTPSAEGLIPTNPSAMTYNIDTAVETIFDSIKHNFEQDSENLKDEYIKMTTVVTDRIKVPKPGEDYSEELTLFPISTLFLKTDSILSYFDLKEVKEKIEEFVGGSSKKSGKYFLLESTPSGDPEVFSKELKDIVNNKIISSDGTSPGLFGPVFQTEQKRMVLPRLQAVAEDPANYIKSSHYQGAPGADPGLILLNENRDPADNIELDVDQPNIPLNFSLKAPGFDPTETQRARNKIASQLNNTQLPPDFRASLEEQKKTLDRVLESLTNSIDVMILNFPTVDQSIKFNPYNTQASSIEDRYHLTVREEKILPFEEKILGEGADPDGTGAYFESNITVYKDIEHDVQLLIEELLSDPGEDLYTSSKALKTYKEIINSPIIFSEDISSNQQNVPSESTPGSAPEFELDNAEPLSDEIYSDSPATADENSPLLIEENTTGGGEVPLIDPGAISALIGAADTDSIFLNDETSINKYKDRFKCFKSVLFAKLITRKYKEDILKAYADSGFFAGAPEAVVKEELLNLHFYHTDNTLISLHEKNIFHLIKELGFKPVIDSDLFDLDKFEKFDITPDNPENLDSNKCLPDNSAGSAAPDSLLDIDKVKEFVEDNYQQKTCLQRLPGEPNPLKESMLEAGIMLLIRVAFVDYCFNSLVALTSGDLTDDFANDQTVITVANKVDKYLSSGGPEIRESIYNSIVKYLNDQIKLNIDLLDPFDPDNLSAKLTSQNITRRRGLKFLCKKIILETSPIIDQLISDFKETYNVTGLEELLASYMQNPSDLFDPPSNLNKLNIGQYMGEDVTTAADSPLYDGYVFKPTAGPEQYFLESAIYKDSPNITYDANYDSNIVGREISNYPGSFFVEKYVRIEYISPPDAAASNLGEYFFFLNIDENDNANKSSARNISLNVTSLSNLQRIILLQTMIASLPELENKVSVKEGDAGYTLLVNAGINPDRYNNWSLFWGPYGSISPYMRKDFINFKLGTRLIYKMPSKNLSPIADGSPPEIGYFIKNSPHGKFEDNVVGSTFYNFPDGTIPKSMFSNEIVKNNFENLQFKEATYQIRTISKQNNEIFIDGAPDIRAIPVKDHLMFPIASAEKDFKELNDALYKWSDIRKIVHDNSGGHRLFDPGHKQLISEMRDAFYKLNSKGDTNIDIHPVLGSPDDILPSPPEGGNASLSLNAIITSNSVAASRFDTLFLSFYKKQLMSDLENTPEVKLLVKHILPTELFRSLSTDYMNIFPKSRTIPNDHFFNQTRNTLFSLFNAAINGEDFKYRDPGGANGLQKHKNANKRKSTQFNLIPSLQKLALETVPMILKGLAETIDPAVASANFITIAAGLDPKETKKITLAFLPPPLFPPLGFNNVPITPMGMAHLALEFTEPYTKLLDKKKNKKECDDESSEDHKLNNPTDEEVGEGEATVDKDLGGLK